VRAQRLYGSKSGKQEKGVLGCSEILPVIFVGLGNPMNTVLENGYTEAWRLIGKQTPRPKAILSIPAHWFVPETGVTVSTAPRTIHDFGGFRRELYPVQLSCARRSGSRSPRATNAGALTGHS
jgi:aromatic ring-opening dioxygenase catalytic subunit (LigB family)